MATTFTVSSRDYIRPYRNVRVISRPEGASQTFKKGDPLKYGADAGHEERVIIAGSDPSTIIGFAAENASGTTDTPISVWVADAQAEFIGCVEDGRANDMTHLAVIGYGIVADATNLIWRVDISETTADVVKITSLAPGVLDGDTNGKVIFHVLAAASQVFAR